ATTGCGCARAEKPAAASSAAATEFSRNVLRGGCNVMPGLDVPRYFAPDGVHPRIRKPAYPRSKQNDRNHHRADDHARRNEHHQEVQVFLDLHGILRSREY